jgi:hypothetical protein
MSTGVTLGGVTAEKPEKSAWVNALPKHGSSAADFGKVVEEDGDAAETEYYDLAADPTYVRNEQDQRRYRGMYRRRLRHLLARKRDRE